MGLVPDVPSGAMRSTDQDSGVLPSGTVICSAALPRAPPAPFIVSNRNTRNVPEKRLPIPEHLDGREPE